MQSEDLVSDNSSPTNENQRDGVPTAPSNDQPTADNLDAAQESTPTLSTSAPVLRTVANVEQTQSYSSRGVATHDEDHGQLDQQPTMFEATSVQVSGPSNTRVSSSNSEQEMPSNRQLGEQLKILSSEVQQVGQRLLRFEQTTRERSAILTSQLEKIMENFGKLFKSRQQTIPQNQSHLVEHSMMTTLASSTSSSNTATTSADNTERSMSLQEGGLRDTNVPVLGEGIELQRTSQESKPLVWSLVRKFESLRGCMTQPCSSELSPESPTNNESQAVTSVISKQPTLTSCADDSVMGNFETSQPATRRVRVHRRTLPEGKFEFELCYYDEHSGKWTNFERRESFPLTSGKLLEPDFPPLGYTPHEEATTLGAGGEIPRHCWVEPRAEELLHLRKNTLLTHRASTGTGSATDNLGTIQPAEEPNSIATGEIRTKESEIQRQRLQPLPPFLPRLEEEEETQLSKNNSPVMEGLQNTLMPMNVSTTAATVTSSTPSNLPSTSSEHKEEDVPLEEQQQFLQGREFTPSDETPPKTDSLDCDPESLSNHRKRQNPSDAEATRGSSPSVNTDIEDLVFDEEGDMPGEEDIPEAEEMPETGHIEDLVRDEEEDMAEEEEMPEAGHW